MQQISAFESATLFSCVCVFLSHPVVDGKCLFKEEADFYEILNITSFQVWLLCVQATPADGLCRWRGPNGCLQPKHVQWTRALQVSRDVFPPLPTAQCLNSAAKNYLCYVSWLRMCQLLTVLTGVIFQCWISALTGSVQVHMGARLMTHRILYQLAFRA